MIDSILPFSMHVSVFCTDQWFNRRRCLSKCQWDDVSTSCRCPAPTGVLYVRSCGSPQVR